MSPPDDITVAVVTYRRPTELRRLLGSLGSQRTCRGSSPSVLVVDNDPEGSAASVVQGVGVDVSYVHEGRPGIAAARNAALDSAVTRFVVFIDDDEEPSDRWLETLTRCYTEAVSERAAESGPDSHGGCVAGVVGAVVSRWDGDIDPWLEAGRFFVRRRLHTGTRVRVAATNNLLLDRDVVGSLRFDDAFGTSGGSDTVFSRRLTGAGHELVWCDEAVVTDVVPADRLTRSWVVRRAVRMGNSWARCELELVAGGAVRRNVVRCRLVVGGTARLLAGGARAGVGTVLGSTVHSALGVRTAARGVGLLAGALGMVVEEYRRRQGSSPDGRARVSRPA